MDVFKSSRFWLATIIILGTFILAILKLITGYEAVSTALGLLAGFGVAKTNVTKKNLPPVACLLGIVIMVGSLVGCASTLTQLNRVHEATKIVSSITEPVFHLRCSVLATKCRDEGDTVCLPWIECDKQRHEVNLSIKAAQTAIAAGIALDAINENKPAYDRMKIATEALSKAYSLAQRYGVLEGIKQ